MRIVFQEHKKNNIYSYKKIFIIMVFMYFYNNLICLEDNHSLKWYYRKYLCSLFIINDEHDCKNELLNNYDFFFNLQGIKRNVHLSIDIKNKSSIENIILIIGIIPFLKFSSFIKYKINDKNTYQLFKIIFSNKTIKNEIIFFYYNDIETIKKNFQNLIDYIWEFIPQQKILDNIRYIINNYYDDRCLFIYEKSLNNNYEYFVEKNINTISNSISKNLLSK